MKKEKNIRLLIAALCLCAVVGAVWLVAAGYAEAAMETLIRWGEDGTLTAFEAVMLDRVIPMLAGFGTSAFAFYLALKKKFKAIDRAKEQMDASTGEAVKTYGAHTAMNQRLETFMEEQRRANERQRQEMQEEFDAMAREQRASLAADRASMRRIEGKVDGIRRVEAVAFGATGELVKNGTATQIVHIIEDTEGAEASPGPEGGEGREAVGDDGEAAEETEAHW